MSEDGWSVSVTITKKQATPGGTERAVGSQKYNFKKTPPGGETTQHRESRLRVKRKARQLALAYFDPEQHEKLKQKRRKSVRAPEVEPAAAVRPEQVPADAGVQPHALAALPAGAGASADDDGERARQRDWALLRALKAGVPPAATWQTLASSHLIDGMEWSVQDMMSRHAYVKECMSVVANLLGPELSGHKLAALHDVCS